MTFKYLKNIGIFSESDIVLARSANNKSEISATKA